MKFIVFASLVSVVFGVGACGSPAGNYDGGGVAGFTGSGGSAGSGGAAPMCSGVRPHSFTLNGPCEVEVQNPTRILITTTDFATGAMSLASAAAGKHEVSTNLALAKTDSLPFYHAGKVYIVHRMGFDRIDIRDPSDNLELVGQHPLNDPGFPSINPQSIVFGSDGSAFVPTGGSPYLFVLDFSKAPGKSVVKRIDLSPYADADGKPEATLSVSCGSTVFVAARKLKPDLSTTGPEIIIPVDVASCQPYPSFESLGHWVKAIRPDPTDASGHKILALSDNGIERIDLAKGTTSWAIADTVFTSVGIGQYEPWSFDLHGDDTVYLGAYADDFTVDIWRMSLSGASAPKKILSGLGMNHRTMEIVGDEMWFGDTTKGHEGMRVYDLTKDPPTLIAGPLDTGLPPYSVIALP